MEGRTEEVLISVAVALGDLAAQLSDEGDRASSLADASLLKSQAYLLYKAMENLESFIKEHQDDD
jgi:hypothetical protein